MEMLVIIIRYIMGKILELLVKVIIQVWIKIFLYATTCNPVQTLRN